MDRKDIETIIEKFDENRNTAYPPKLTVKYKSKKYQVYNMQLQEDQVVLTLIKNNFNFGDGYYEFISPTMEQETEVWISFTDPMLENITHQVLNTWENLLLSFSSPMKQERIETIKHFKRTAVVRKKIERKIKDYQAYAKHALVQDDKDRYLKTAEEYSQLLKKF